ncbi:MAG: hypothetical protein R3C28_08745 [Pirellulaceae bacterium]
MNSHASQLEQALTDKTVAQTALHQAALQLAQQLTQALESGQEFELLTKQLDTTMQQVRSLEPELQQLRTAWNVSNSTAGPELKQAVEQAKTVLLALMDAIAQSESLMQNAKSRMMPELSQEARFAKMRQTYTSR